MSLTSAQIALLIKDEIYKALQRQYAEQLVGNPEVVKTYERLYQASINVSNIILSEMNSIQTAISTDLRSTSGITILATGGTGSVSGIVYSTYALPLSPSVDDRVTIVDAYHSFGVNNFTIQRNGKKILGLDQDYFGTVNGSRLEFLYVNETQGWTLTGDYGSETIMANTSAGIASHLLPANPRINDKVIVVDTYHTFGTNNYTIQRNGRKIMGVSTDFVCNVNGQRLELVYVNSTLGWSIAGIYGAVYS